MKSVIEDVSGGGFSTLSQITGQRLAVKLSGCLDLQTTPHLRTFLRQLIPIIKAGIAQVLEFDTCELYMMSSSSISCLAGWVKELKDGRIACQVEFRTNPNLTWQRRTLDPIRRFADQIVVVV